MFSAYTQALRDLDLSKEGSRVLNKIISDISFNLQGASSAKRYTVAAMAR